MQVRDDRPRRKAPSMPAVAYASLIRILRTLEDEGLDSQEAEIVRAAADAKLLRDYDSVERVAEAEELLDWLEESDSYSPQLIARMRRYLAAIHPPIRRVAAGPPPRRRGPLRRVLSALRAVFASPRL